MDLDDVLRRNDGVAGRTELVRALGRNRLDTLVRQQTLTALFPRAYAYLWDADLDDIVRRAALVSVGGEVAFSHLTALSLRDLPVPVDAPLHVTAYQTRHPRGVPDRLVVHRTLRPLRAQLVQDLPTVELEPALVDSWPLLGDGLDRRAPLLEAWRRRIVSGVRLSEAVEQMWWVRGCRELRDVTALLLAGCESWLELWGHAHVFNIPELADANRQREVHVGDKTYRLDIAFDEEMLAVELDGRQYTRRPSNGNATSHATSPLPSSAGRRSGSLIADWSPIRTGVGVTCSRFAPSASVVPPDTPRVGRQDRGVGLTAARHAGPAAAAGPRPAIPGGRRR